jgi:hypothetical protein
VRRSLHSPPTPLSASAPYSLFIPSTSGGKAIGEGGVFLFLGITPVPHLMRDRPLFYPHVRWTIALLGRSFVPSNPGLTRTQNSFRSSRRVYQSQITNHRFSRPSFFAMRYTICDVLPFASYFLNFARNNCAAETIIRNRNEMRMK